MYPSEFLIWKTIEWCKENKISTFDLMGAGKPNEDYGVREFKKGFSPLFSNFGRLKKIHRLKTYNFVFSQIEIMKKIRGK